MTCKYDPTDTMGLSGFGGNGNESVLYIHQSSMTGSSTSDGLVSYSRHSLGGGSYSASLSDWVV